MSRALSYPPTYPPAYPLSIAPMMGRTDRHFRYFMRGITRHTLLYTPMISANAIIHGRRHSLLAFSEKERPLVLQLGGAEADKLAKAARIACDWGYNGFNLNVGCPSARVGKGNFGARLMADPDRVGECVAAIQAATNCPVSVKHRTGIIHQNKKRKLLKELLLSEEELYEQLLRFVYRVAQYGCQHFIVHARLAILDQFSPRENRTIPPLQQAMVRQLAEDCPHLKIEINGGIKNMEEALSHLKRESKRGRELKEKELKERESKKEREAKEKESKEGESKKGRELKETGAIAGVMIGRAAFETPCIFATADRDLYGCQNSPPTRREILQHFALYLDHLREDGYFLQQFKGGDHSRSNHGNGEEQAGFIPRSVTKSILHLFGNIPGGRFFRQYLSNGMSNGSKTYSSAEKLLQEASLQIPSHYLDSQV